MRPIKRMAAKFSSAPPDAGNPKPSIVQSRSKLSKCMAFKMRTSSNEILQSALEHIKNIMGGAHSCNGANTPRREILPGRSTLG